MAPITSSCRCHFPKWPFVALVGIASYAASWAAQGEGGEHQVTPVVVTASRGTVGGSMAELDRADIDASKMNSLEDVQQRVPGLVVTRGGTGLIQPYIRGHGTDLDSIGVDNAVAVYVDGVYQTRPIGEVLQFIDVDHVEVYRGAQSVRYAHGATAGAINVVSKAASAVAEGRLSAMAGDHGMQSVQGSVSNALSDVVRGRITAVSSHDDGDTVNKFLNRRVNGSDVRGVRGSLQLVPDASFNFTLNAFWLHKQFSPTIKPIHTETNPIFTMLGATNVADLHTVMQNQIADVGLTQKGLSATAKWMLDGATLTSITAAHNTDYNARRGDIDGTELPIAQVGSPTTGTGVPFRSSYFSQEFTLEGKGGSPWSWLALAGYEHERARDLAWNYNYPFYAFSTNATSAVSTDIFSAGAEATYRLDSHWRVTGGGRLTTVDKELESLQTFTSGFLTGSAKGKRHWSAFTPKLAVEYAPDSHSTWYASVSKGFKSGGFNTFSVQQAFNPESSINQEVGFKGQWLEGRVWANLAVFNTRYRDMHVAVDVNNGGAVQSIIQNAQSAVSRGIEASIGASPTDKLEVSSAVQFMRARYVEFMSVDPRFPAQGQSNLKNNPMTRAPDVTAFIALQYSWPLLQGGYVRLRGEQTYRSRTYFTPFNDEKASSPGVSVLNASLSYDGMNATGWSGSLFVKNLTDQKYFINVIDPPGLGYLAYVAPGRTVGIQGELRY